MNFFFDLDGTLLDCRYRMFGLFSELVGNCTWNIDEYWDRKRNGATHRALLTQYFGYDQIALNDFEEKWMKKIEEQGRLQLDKPQPFIEKVLMIDRKAHHLHLITARQSDEMVFNQLAWLKWDFVFKNVLVTGKKQSKAELINEKFGNSLKVSDMLFGDTPEDIETGKKIGVKTIGVSNGFKNEEILAACKPDVVIPNLFYLTYPL